MNATGCWSADTAMTGYTSTLMVLDGSDTWHRSAGGEGATDMDARKRRRLVKYVDKLCEMHNDLNLIDKYEVGEDLVEEVRRIQREIDKCANRLGRLLEDTRRRQCT